MVGPGGASSGAFLFLFAIALFIAGVLYLIATKIGPRQVNPLKMQPFECGNIAKVRFNQRVSIKFYVVALLFILFDMEAVYLFPWAVVFRDLGWPGFVSMLSFVSILVLGLVYVWKKGALDWE